MRLLLYFLEVLSDLLISQMIHGFSSKYLVVGRVID